MTEGRAAPDIDIGRASLDLEIRRDGEVLGSIVALFREGRSMSSWPSTAEAALRQAMWPRHANTIEQEKARRLRRHLFVDMPPPALSPYDAVPGRWSDRIRADLPDLVPFAAGLTLLQGDEG